MPKPLELRKVIRVLKKYGIIYITGKGRHPKFFDPETHNSRPLKNAQFCSSSRKSKILTTGIH
jgi:hypothetical protein